MKNKTLIIIVIITATAAVLSLGIYQKRTHQINASLLQIEQLMYERPDSAWKILQHMPPILQLRKEEQALHALLFTQAQYKNYIPVKSDSLLRIAEAYYRTSNDSLHKAWTLFYLAQYYRDSDEKEKALSYFQQANIASRNIENNQFKFLLNLHWAGLLTNEDAYEKGIEKYQTANRYAILLKDTLKQINLYGKWGWCCLLKEEDERADSLFNVGLTLSATTKDRIYDKYLLNRLSLTARERKDYKRALELVNRSLSLAKDSTELYPLWGNKGKILLEKTIDLHAAQEKIIEKETALDKELSQREKMRSEYSSKEAAMRKEILRHSEIIRKMEQLNKMSQQDKIQSRSVVLSDEEQDNLAEVINICYNNFTDRLWKKFPTLTKADISLCCLIKIGISNSNMLYLLETNKVALKKRKNRLKHDKMGMDENDSLDEFIMEF